MPLDLTEVPRHQAMTNVLLRTRVDRGCHHGAHEGDPLNEEVHMHDAAP